MSMATKTQMKKDDFGGFDFSSLSSDSQAVIPNKSDSKSLSDTYANLIPDASDIYQPSQLTGTRRQRRTDNYNPYAGRSKDITNGDLAGAVRSLNLVLRLNNVKLDQREQKFYEKPHDRRIRLSSERHRKRFKAGVRRLVSVVKEMRKRGV